MRKDVALLILIVFTVLFCSLPNFKYAYSEPSSTSDDWPMLKHDAAHTGFTTSSAPTSMPTILWNVTKGHSGNPSVAEGYVVTNSQSGIFCFNATNGNKLWQQRNWLGTNLETTPAISNGIVYTEYTAFNLSTGNLLLNYTEIGGSAPTISEGILYIGSYGSIFSKSSVSALNASTGAAIWNYPTPGPIVAPISVAEGLAYFSCWDGNIYALNAATGKKVWNYSDGGSHMYMDSTPSVAYGNVYVGTNDKFICLKATTGQELWSLPIPYSASIGAAALGYIYMYDADAYLCCFDAFTGVKIWTSPAMGTAVVANDIIIATSGIQNANIEDTGILCAVNVSTGAILWNFNFTGDPNDDRDYHDTSAPAVVDGIIYVGDSNRLYAFGAPNSSTSLVPALTPSPSPTVPEFPAQVQTIFVGATILVVSTILLHKRQIKNNR